MSNAEQPVRPLGVPVLEDLPDPAGRHILVRADLDIPTTHVGPLDESRHLRRLEPTVRWLSEHDAKITICGHQGPLWQRG